MLAEVGVHPELAQVLESAPVARQRDSSIKENKSVTAGLRRDDIAAGDDQASYLLRSYIPHLSKQ